MTIVITKTPMPNLTAIIKGSITVDNNAEEVVEGLNKTRNYCTAKWQRVGSSVFLPITITEPANVGWAVKEIEKSVQEYEDTMAKFVAACAA